MKTSTTAVPRSIALRNEFEAYTHIYYASPAHIQDTNNKLANNETDGALTDLPGLHFLSSVTLLSLFPPCISSVQFPTSWFQTQNLWQDFC